MICLIPFPAFPSQNVKGQGHMRCSKFLACPFVPGPMPIWSNRFIYGANITQEMAMWPAPFLVKRSMANAKAVWVFCPLRGLILIWRIRFIYGTNSTHESRCVAQHFQVNSKVKVTGVINVLNAFQWKYQYISIFIIYRYRDGHTFMISVFSYWIWKIRRWMFSLKSEVTNVTHK